MAHRRAILFLKYLTSSNRFYLNTPSIRSAVAWPLSFSFKSHIFSPLSSIADDDNKTLTEFLINECGLCPSDITKVKKRMPRLVRTRSNQTAQEAVQLLRDSGFTESQLKKTIVGNPTIIAHKAYGQLKPKIELLKTLVCQDLGNVISHKPRLLTCSLETLKSKVEYVKTLGVSEGSKGLMYALDMIGSTRLENIPKKVEFVKSLGILEGSKAFVYALNAVVQIKHENMEKKLKLMASFGLEEEEIQKIVKRNPSLLALSVDTMQRNMNFLTHTAGLTPRILLSYDRLLNYNVEKRLMPRYRVFRYLSTVQHDKNAKHLRNPARMFTVSEETFLQKFVKCSAQAEILFDIYKGKSADFTIT